MFKEVVYFREPFKRYDLTPHVKREEFKDMHEALQGVLKNRDKFLLWQRVNKKTGEKFIRTVNHKFLETL